MELVNQQGFLNKINLLLKNINNIRGLRYSGGDEYINVFPQELKNCEFIKKQETYIMPGGEEQGRGNESYEIYKIPYLNTYLKIYLTTDSYGDNEHIDSIKFVKPTEKTITIYE